MLGQRLGWDSLLSEDTSWRENPELNFLSTPRYNFLLVMAPTISYSLLNSQIQEEKLSSFLSLPFLLPCYSKVYFWGLLCVNMALVPALEELLVPKKGGGGRFMRRLKMKDFEGNWKCWEESRRSWVGKKKDSAIMELEWDKHINGRPYLWVETNDSNYMRPGNFSWLWSFQNM